MEGEGGKGLCCAWLYVAGDCTVLLREASYALSIFCLAQLPMQLVQKSEIFLVTGLARGLSVGGISDNVERVVFVASSLDIAPPRSLLSANKGKALPATQREERVRER
jgi:hypothetical protein